MKNNSLIIIINLLFCLITLSADVKLSSMYSDHAVIQRNVPFKVWGWADPSEKVTVNFVNNSLSTEADAEGNWSVTFPAQKAGGPHNMTVVAKNSLKVSNILFGEVWVCSGQSNMGWNVDSSVDGDLEVLLAKDTELRILHVGGSGSQTPQKDVMGKWAICTGQDLLRFSAVGYYYGRELRRALGVPVGLIGNAYGGSACEAWVPRDVLKSDKRNHPYIESFAKTVASYDEAKEIAAYEKKLAKWKIEAKKAKDEGLTVPRPPRKPRDPRYGQHRPANLWNTRIYPLLGYAIKGAIWYQGENNANYRAYNYRYLLPMMIKTWRDQWGLGDFSFYWSQLADFGGENKKYNRSYWAEIRESMTVAMQTTPKTGQAVITDLGEAADIHPRRKLEVAQRLVRWALAKDYGFKLTHASPMYKSHEIKGNKIIITLDQDVKTLDVKDVLGFAIAGEDKNFIDAKAVIKKNIIEVWSDSIKKPLAVRYAWTNNPVCNVINNKDLPLTPFRTDDWKLGSQ